MSDKVIAIRRPMAAIALVLALALGGATAWFIAAGGHTALGAGRSVTLKVADDSSPAATRVSFAEGFAAIVQPNLPAVVNISTSKMVKNPQLQNPFENDPFFQQFFGHQFGGQQAPEQQQPKQQREMSLGSGVIVSPDGYILTNNHVIDGASDIKVSLKDKREFKAQLIGADPKSDLAVLKIPATDLTAITFGDSAKTQVGDFVLAIGDPFGVGETVTMGIVSATGRNSLDIEEGGYEDFIQTDAAINPGNSGGALINVRGELVGINTAILTGNEGGGNEGVGFAIPVDMARGIMQQILKNGKVTRGYLGIMIQEVTPDVAKAFGLPSSEGALVGDVKAGGPASKAGMQRGDVILTLNGQPVEDSRSLRLHIASMAPGQTVQLGVQRNQTKLSLSVTLAELPETPEAASAPGAESAPSAVAGVDVDTLTSDIAGQLGLPAETHGVVVTQVDPSSAAAETGLQRGDVIQEVNRTPVASVDQYTRAVKAANGQQLLLLINRAGTTHYVVIPAE
ncbi:MAG: DegQ family serine endoprotease [Candidatus Acidiferrales bacterium]|jgi:serine protease Do